jgi:lipid-A-disaccharide synthase-like uncharacterized protein
MEVASGQFLQPYLAPYVSWLYTSSRWWTVVGFGGSILFGSRFVFQWLVSERKHQLVVPATFWHLSFWGSILNLMYVLHLDNAPLLLGVIALPFLYGRNLVLLRKGRKTQRSNSTETAAPSDRTATVPL